MSSNAESDSEIVKPVSAEKGKSIHKETKTDSGTNAVSQEFYISSTKLSFHLTRSVKNIKYKLTFYYYYLIFKFSIHYTVQVKYKSNKETPKSDATLHETMESHSDNENESREKSSKSL